MARNPSPNSIALGVNPQNDMNKCKQKQLCQEEKQQGHTFEEIFAYQRAVAAETIYQVAHNKMWGLRSSSCWPVSNSPSTHGYSINSCAQPQQQWELPLTTIAPKG
eukprot:6213942-Amphidinium_carterae.1